MGGWMGIEGEGEGVYLFIVMHTELLCVAVLLCVCVLVIVCDASSV